MAFAPRRLALFYHSQGKYGEAEVFYKRALAVWEKALGPNHLDLASSLENYAALLRATRRESEALERERRAQEVRAKHAEKDQGP